SSRRRHTRSLRDWSSDVCSSDLRDSGSGVRETVDLPVTAFSARPGASDLLLAYAIRPVAGADTVPAASEVRKGNLFIATAPDLKIGRASCRDRDSVQLVAVR